MQIPATNAYSSALAGVSEAQRRLDDDADRIAQDPFDVDALVESTWQPRAVQANGQVLRAVDESTGAPIDVLG
jgi:hypothetical protein